MANRHKGPLINREAALESDGTVHFVFLPGETDIPGFYDAEFLVRYADYREETFPHTGKIKITIESRIGGV